MLLLLLALIFLIANIFIIISVVKQHKKGLTKRPVILTVLCLINFELLGIILVAIIYRFEELSPKIGQGLMVTQIFLLLGALIGSAGIWIMKKWGAFLFLGAQGIGLLINLIDKENLEVMKESGYFPLITIALSIGIVVYHFKKFTD